MPDHLRIRYPCRQRISMICFRNVVCFQFVITAVYVCNFGLGRGVWLFALGLSDPVCPSLDSVGHRRVRFVC